MKKLLIITILVMVGCLVAGQASASPWTCTLKQAYQLSGGSEEWMSVDLTFNPTSDTITVSNPRYSDDPNPGDEYPESPGLGGDPLGSGPAEYPGQDYDIYADGTMDRVYVAGVAPFMDNTLFQSYGTQEGAPADFWQESADTSWTGDNGTFNAALTGKEVVYQGPAITTDFREPIPEPSTVFIFSSLLGGFGFLTKKFKLLIK